MPRASISLHDIRPLRGKQAEGFEELCAQLARVERPARSRFVRKGTPDAGVECFAVLEDGSEWGWQAKYFTGFGPKQWKQLDESVATALDKHPQLGRYIICVPLNRSDARVAKQQSALQAWDTHVRKWHGWATTAGRSVEFEYWGESEILDLLAQPAHAGRLRFWFDTQVFDEAWFATRLQLALDAAGARYTQELNLQVPIAEKFEIVGRTKHFTSTLQALAKDIRENSRHLSPGPEVLADGAISAAYAELTGLLGELLPKLGRLEISPTDPLPLPPLVQTIGAINQLIESLGRLVRQASLARPTQQQVAPWATSRNPYEEFQHRLYRLQEPLRKTQHRFEEVLRITSTSLLVLTGAAGTGKSHLLCDVARNRLAAGYPTVLLMGQQFLSNEAPWAQALRLLDLATASVEEVVGALEAAAQAADSRLLLLIDALNEGTGRAIWPDHLAAFLTPLTRSPWIGVVLSVRSSYTEVVVPAAILTQAYRLEHRGFAGQEYDAAKSFFLHYHLELPSTPLLAPEFSNPLFLKTLCDGLQSTGQPRLPRGFHGLTDTFNLYLDGVNTVLQKRLGYHARQNLVRQALQAFAQESGKTDARWLPLPTALALLQGILPSQNHEQLLYQGLVVEGVLTEEAGYKQQDDVVVFIAYERLADHLFINSKLDQYLDAKNPVASFASGQPLAPLGDLRSRYHEGQLEALFIQVPERTGKELSELLPDIVTEWHGRAFRQSLIWRSVTAFSADTAQVLGDFDAIDGEIAQTLEVLLTVASLPEHPLNAKFLDRHLRDFTLPERDGWWSVPLHYLWDEQGALHRLVDWAVGLRPASRPDEQAVDLCAIALAWLFTSSNRFLRDRATKALANLLTGRLPAATRLVARFAKVNDPYVAERVYAAAYGAATRSFETVAVGQLAASVYQLVFAQGTPPVHLLLRDYARGIVERALYLGADLALEVSRIRPPYRSTWPAIPSQAELDALFPDRAVKWQTNDDGEWARQSIKDSVEDGDFGRYVIDSAVNDWLSVPLTEPVWLKPSSNNDLLNELVEGLSEAEWAAWQAHEQAVEAFKEAAYAHFQQLAAAVPAAADLELFFTEYPPEVEALWDQATALASAEELAAGAARQTLLTTLTPEHARQLTEIENREEPAYEDRQEPEFDSEIARRYVVSRALALGDTFELVGHFDKHGPDYAGRSAHKAERMGKKYQWIALHEILAFMADHYQFREYLSSHEESLRAYEGPWQPNARDIDPSNVLRAKVGRTSWLAHAPAWWAPPRPQQWHQPPAPQHWLAEWRNLPPVEELLLVRRPGEATAWLNLEGRFNWAEPLPPDLDDSDVERRRFWYFASAYLVRAADEAAFTAWVGANAIRGWKMPEPVRMSELFLGEHGWAAASQYYQGSHGWQESWQRPRRSCPVEAQLVAATYSNEQGDTDCSLDDSITLNLLRAELLAPLGLRWTGSGADFVDATGQLAAFDPTVAEQGPSALLVRADLLRDFLAREQLRLCWVVTGEKQVMGANLRGNYLGRLSMSGAYTLTEQGVTGFLNCYLSRPSQDEQDPEVLLHTIGSAS